MSLRQFSFSDMKIANKLAVFVLVLSLPIGVLLFSQYRAGSEKISVAERESDGMTYVAAVIPFMTEVQTHRSLAQAVLNGGTTSEAALQKSVEAGDAALANLQAVDKKFGKEFKTGAMVNHISDQWKSVRELQPGQNAAVNAQVHTELVAGGVIPLLESVVANSGLAVDPNLASRSLITALTESMPRMNEALSQARGYSAAIIIQRRDGSATGEQREFLATQLGIAKLEGEAMARSLETAMQNNPEFEKSLRPILSSSTTARQSFSGAVVDLMQSATTGNIIFTLGERATEVSTDLLNESQVGLEREFNSRVDSARMDLYSTGGVALGGIVVALLMAMTVSKTITRPISHLAEVADRMSLGELDVEIDVQGNNEVGQLAESLRRMQASLRSAIERLRQRRQAAA